MFPEPLLLSVADQLRKKTLEQWWCYKWLSEAQKLGLKSHTCTLYCTCSLIWSALGQFHRYGHYTQRAFFNFDLLSADNMQFIAVFYQPHCTIMTCLLLNKKILREQIFSSLWFWLIGLLRTLQIKQPPILITTFKAQFLWFMKRLMETNAYFFIGKCSKFSSVTLNFSEIYPNCFSFPKKLCCGHYTKCYRHYCLWIFSWKLYYVYYNAKKLLISFIFMC